MKKVCLYCGKQFDTFPCRVKADGGKYCSRKCSGKAHYKIIKRKCRTCGKIFNVRPSDVKYHATKFCSSGCCNLARVGKGNSHWKGGEIYRHGYVYCLVSFHPHALIYGKTSYMKRSRLVMEKKLSRYLTPKEIVHHINGVINDDSPSNLYLMRDHSQHTGYHSRLYLTYKRWGIK